MSKQKLLAPIKLEEEQKRRRILTYLLPLQYLQWKRRNHHGYFQTREEEKGRKKMRDLLPTLKESLAGEKRERGKKRR